VAKLVHQSALGVTRLVLAGRRLAVVGQGSAYRGQPQHGLLAR
jgi:hypothetical protein